MKIRTFEQLVYQYVKEKPLSKATVKTYKSVVTLFIKDTNIRYLKDVDFESLLEWRLKIIERSSDITWNNYLRHMRALWAFAIKKNYVSNFDPFKELHWGKYKTAKKKTVSVQKLKRVLLYLSLKDCGMEPCWFWGAVIRFIFFTGMRRKQIVKLKWKHLDLKRGRVQVTRNSDKMDNSRQVPMNEELIDCLYHYRAMIMQVNPAAYHPNKQVFNITLLNDKYKKKKKGRMTRGQLSGFFKRLSKRMGFRISSHMLRHSMATIIAETGKYKHLQKILGHSDVRTTLTSYVHPNLKQLHKVVNDLPKI